MNNFDVNNNNDCQDDYENYMDELAKEEMLEESKEQSAIFSKYYDMLTFEEKFDLAESEFLDNDYDPYWYLGPKSIVENRRKKDIDNE